MHASEQKAYHEALSRLLNDIGTQPGQLGNITLKQLRSQRIENIDGKVDYSRAKVIAYASIRIPIQAEAEIL